jgi:hypothetical protein
MYVPSIHQNKTIREMLAERNDVQAVIRDFDRVYTAANGIADGIAPKARKAMDAEGARLREYSTSLFMALAGRYKVVVVGDTGDGFVDLPWNQHTEYMGYTDAVESAKCGVSSFVATAEGRIRVRAHVFNGNGVEVWNTQEGDMR